MKKLSLSVLVTSALILSACGGDSQDATDSAADTGAAIVEQTAEMTENAGEAAAEHAEHAMEKGKEMATEVGEHGKDMMDGAMEAGKDVMDKATDMAKDKMHEFTGSGFHKGTTGHTVGTQADIDALTAEYHEKMKALNH